MRSFHVPDMSCGHCVSVVTRALKTADPTSTIRCDLARRTVSVQSDTLDPEEIRDALAEAGYPAAEHGT